MQNSQNFEERILIAKEEIAALLAGERESSADTHLQHAARIAADCQRNHPATQGRQPLNRKERAAYNQQVKPVEERLLRRWATASNLWVEEKEFNERYTVRFLDKGAEQKVYLGQTGKAVIKINTGTYHGTWLEYFIRLILHETLFSSTAYRLTGFTEQEGQFSAVVQQPFVDVKHGAAKDDVDAFLLPLGFINLKNYDYYNRKHGIILEDLHDENIFSDEQGTLYFVDPVIYLETRDMGFNGPSQFRFPF